MTGVVVSTQQVGPVRATIVAYGGALALFSAKERNDIVRGALLAGGQYWLGAFLPKRFSVYAFTLGYRVSEKWRRTKQWQLGAAVPFVGGTPPGGGPRMPSWKGKNGEKMITAALSGATASATATAGNSKIVWLIPFGHAVRPETSEAFRMIPTWEVERIAEHVSESLGAYFAGAGLVGAQTSLVGAASSIRTGATRPAIKQPSMRSRSTGSRAPRKVA